MGPAERIQSTNPFQFNIAWVLAYLTVMALISAGLSYGRFHLLAAYGSPEAKAEWDQWRTDAKKMASGAGPVKRREPKSREPPALVLMRDHFAVCLGFALLLSTVLFGTFMIFQRGAIRDTAAGQEPRPPNSRSPIPDSRPPSS
jgi:hypothetical protein